MNNIDNLQMPTLGKIIQCGRSKKHESFEDWLKKRDPQLHEIATSTNCIAPFLNRVGPIVRRGEVVKKKKDIKNDKK